MRTCNAVVLLALFTGCGDSPTTVDSAPATELGIVVSSIDRVATIFAVDSVESLVQVGLGPDGTPIGVAARNGRAVVPLGVYPAAAIVDMRQRRVVATVALPVNSGATGVAFVSDSIALVANPGRNSVTPVNVLRGMAGAEIAVGTYPQAIAAVDDTAYVLNGELGPDFEPARNGTITVLAGAMPRVIATIELSGRNPLAAVVSGGDLHVLNAGSFGSANGSLATVDRRTLLEVRHDTGFGDFPGAIARGGDGNLYVGSFAYGVAIWQPATRTFLRSPANAVQPGGIGANSGLGVDEAGRVYALIPQCREPGSVVRLGPTFDVAVEIATGICPFGIVFSSLDAGT